MKTGAVLSVLNEENCYSSLVALSVCLGSRVCRMLEYRNMYLIVWDEMWKTYHKGRWCNIVANTQQACRCQTLRGGLRSSCCFLRALHRDVSSWKYVLFKSSRCSDLCRMLDIRGNASGSDKEDETESAEAGEYMLVVKLAKSSDSRYDEHHNDMSGLLILRTMQPLDANDATPQNLAKKAQRTARTLISAVSNVYYSALRWEYVGRLLAENNLILSLTQITSQSIYTNVPEIFNRIDQALRQYRSLRLSAIMATDDVNRELVQVWHNKDPECLECKPIPIDCEPVSRCLFCGEAQIVSLSQVRSMNKSTPGRNARKGGDTTERLSPHRRSPKSALLLPPLGPTGTGCYTEGVVGASCPSPLLNDDISAPSPGLISKVQGCPLRTMSEKQGCRLLAPLVGANGITKVVMVIDRKVPSYPLNDTPYSTTSSATDYDAFMLPSLFRVLQNMVRTVSTDMKLQSAINDFVMTTLIAQNQKRRESAPSHCIIEFVYGVIPTKHSEGSGCGGGTSTHLESLASLEPSPPPPPSPLPTTASPPQSSIRDENYRPTTGDSSGGDLPPTTSPLLDFKHRRASAPSNLTDLPSHLDSSSWLSIPQAVQDLWSQSPCLDYFSMSNDQFFEFFDHCLQPYENIEQHNRQSRRGFFDYVMNAYHQSNPYHNKYHAIQVFHVTWQITQMLIEDDRGRATTTAAGLDPELSYSLLLASILHDVDHIGVTNNYLIATSHPLSILYNDRAVLEQHHCAFAFNALAKRPHINLVKSKSVRKHIIDFILATDMAMHTLLMSSLSHLATLGVDSFTTENWSKLGEIILHAADLSNQLTPFPYFVRWAGLCIEEFNRQVDMEIENGIPITSFMNCRSDDTKIEMELGFLEFVVLPLWQPLTLIEPKLSRWYEGGRANSEFWRRCLAKLNNGSAKSNKADGVSSLNISVREEANEDDDDEEEGGEDGEGDDDDDEEDEEDEDDDEDDEEGLLTSRKIPIGDREIDNFINEWNQTNMSLFELERH